ncbi:MAG: hypothetical protein V4675_07910 [Verrucomicrobiota bacterium]
MIQGTAAAVTLSRVMVIRSFWGGVWNSGHGKMHHAMPAGIVITVAETMGDHSGSAQTGPSQQQGCQQDAGGGFEQGAHFEFECERRPPALQVDFLRIAGRAQGGIQLNGLPVK